MPCQASSFSSTRRRAAAAHFLPTPASTMSCTAIRSSPSRTSQRQPRRCATEATKLSRTTSHCPKACSDTGTSRSSTIPTATRSSSTHRERPRRRCPSHGCPARDGRGNAVEEPPPGVERPRHRPPDARLKVGARREAYDHVVADRAVVAVGLLVDVPEGDLLACAAVVALEGARARTERARHLTFGGEIRRRGALDE